MAQRILIVSPTPTHPQDQGNSARIYELGRMLQRAGFLVHLLYYQMEGLTDAQAHAMEECWDGFHPVRTMTRDLRLSASSQLDGARFGLDDWYAPEAGAAALVLHRRWRFSVVITNYVWFSRVLDDLGGRDSDLLKILDTHDVFGERDRRFTDAGMTPEWFFTTHAEEARGLRRADIVLAIQDQEAAHFRAQGHPGVLTIGHFPPQRRRLMRGGAGNGADTWAGTGAGDKLRVGYLASGNPINRDSFSRLCQYLPEEGIPGLELLLAGSICDRMDDAIGPFRRIGRVQELDDFYDRIDLVINPMHFGTGLKIKSVEAIFQGLPMLATDQAMSGLPAQHRLHRLAGPEELAQALCKTRFDVALLEELAAESRRVAEEYVAASRPDFTRLVASIEGHRRAA